MRDINRIEIICNNLKTLWYYFPDMRLGQLIENYIKSTDDFFVQEDDITLKNINETINAAEDFYKKERY